MEVLFNRTPKVRPRESIKGPDLLLSIGPVWMSNIATPYRGPDQRIKKPIKKYGNISICGGADGDNLNPKSELIQRLGMEPAI